MVALVAILRIAILVLAYFGSPVAPVSFIDARPITTFDILPDDYWAWAPGFWLTQGHLILILLWPVATIASRILGRRPAAVAALAAWLFVAGALGTVMVMFSSMFTVSPLPPNEVLAAFVIGMGFSEAVTWRGLSPRPPRPRDAAICAMIFSLLFNALTYGVDPAQAGPRLIVQTILFGLGAGVIAFVMDRIFIRRS